MEFVLLQPYLKDHPILFSISQLSEIKGVFFSLHHSTAVGQVSQSDKKMIKHWKNKRGSWN